ncbi:MAG: flippase-like domain-containing protein, partial [Chloroflexi bacterium]|nr:flippase-like domain-containing protein [Chloroflexota bacterium]
MSRRQRVVLGMVVSAVFLVLALRQTDWAELWELFLGANYLYLIPALFLLVLINWTRAWRWRLLMFPDTHLPLQRVFRIVNIGYFFNNVLPAKAGEVVRAYLVGNVLSGGIGQAASTLLIERLLDVLTVVVLLVILIPFVELPAWAARGGLLFGTLALLGTATLVVLSRFGERGLEWVWRWVGRVPIIGHPKLRRALHSLLKGFGVLTMGRLLPWVLLGSALIWLGYALFNYIILVVFRLSYLPFWAAPLVLCATGFIMILPSSPGAMGVFEWAAVQALSVYGVAQSAAAGYALGLHTFTNLILILFGLWGLAREGLSYRDLQLQATASTEP